MPVLQILQELAKLGVLVFVVSSMLAMGFSLTVQQIVASMHDTSLVVRALLVNFVLVPLVALVLLSVLRLSGPLAIGLILLACSSGAPFLPKYVQTARGDIAFAVGLMTLLMVVTIVFLPIALPFLLPGVRIAPLDIARSLVLEMLVPLALGLVVKARNADVAAALQPVMSRTSTVALVIILALFPVLRLNTVLGAIGSGAVLAALMLIVVSFALGYLLGGPGHASQVVLGFGTAQRNVAAALLVAASNFTDPDVLVMIVIGSTLQLVLLLVTAAELRRHEASPSSLH
jgi:BASS family bile acid:Na+ symporter